MTTSSEIKERRERLGLTQAWIAAKVRDLSGNPKYTQQTYQKFEKNPVGKSAYAVYILQALDEAERAKKQSEVLSEAATEFGAASESNDLAAAMLRRIAQLFYSGKISKSDINLVGQIVERMARE